MLCADDLPVCVVVQHDQLGPPPDENGESGIQARADGGAQALGPLVDASEDAARPVEGAHESAHVASALQTFITFASASGFGICGHDTSEAFLSLTRPP